MTDGAGRDAALLDHPHVHAHVDTLPPPESAARIVSLVPSLSEALVALGLGSRLVGVTTYCVQPPGAFDALPKLGGTKDADVDAAIALAPDLVIANHEENTARIVRRLAEAGIDVWVTYPRTVREGVALLRELASLGATPAAVERSVVPAERALEEARRSAEAQASRPRVFCPIWRDPWMTIGRDTYIHDMIEVCGGTNALADAGREAEAAAGRRYPLVGLDAVERAAPDVILLPDEPYAFDESDRRALAGLDCPAARDGRIHLIDGTLVSWYGPRIAEAIRVLGGILADPSGVGSGALGGADQYPG
jgi:ABC-type hemin transport system substrate-binding protein